MCEVKNKEKSKPEVIQGNQEGHQLVQNQQVNVLDQAEQNQQQLENPIREDLGVVEVEVPNEALEELNGDAIIATYDVVDNAQMVVSQIVSEMSMNSFSMIENASREATAEKRKAYREKVKEKSQFRQSILAEEIQAHRSFLRQCLFYKEELEKKRNELLVKDNLSQEEKEELNSVRMNYADAVKTVDSQEKRVRKKEETYELQSQALELRNIVSELREKCEEEDSDGNVPLMKDVIAQARSFDELINSKDFDITKQDAYMSQLVQIHNAVVKYYDKNKGTKISSKGRSRRDMTKKFLSKLTVWVSDLPEEFQDRFFEEMEKPEQEC